MSTNLPACHQDSPQHAAYVARVEELEAEGCDTSDAQGIADMEFDGLLTQPKKPTKPTHKMKTQDLYKITLLDAAEKESEKIKVGLIITQICGGGRKTICDREANLREAVGIMRFGLLRNIDYDRLESIRLERTGVEYDAEQGTISEEFSETVGDLVDVLNMGDFQCSLSAK